MARDLKNAIAKPPKHVAIILDGNGRWATKRGLPRIDGHRKGAVNVRDIALCAADAEIEVLSVFAFSTENWRRPQTEVDQLMALPTALDEVLWRPLEVAHIQVRFSGRRDRLAAATLALIASLEQKTVPNVQMILNVCLDYGSHDELIHAAKTMAHAVARGEWQVEDIDAHVFETALYTCGLPPVDFLIRTSGEQRLSNFLLWQSAYAELYFTRVHWPSFSPRRFKRALKNYQKRTRKFGGVKG